MKKLLSLILALLFCLSFIVSCEKEDAPSTSEPSSSSEEPTSTGPVEETPSGGEAPTEPEVEFIIDNPYTTYEYSSWGPYFFWDMVSSDEEDEGYKIWTFESYEEYYNFVDDTLIGIEEEIGAERIDIDSIGVKESDFEKHIVLGLYYAPKYPIIFGEVSGHIGLIKEPNGKYILLAETTDYLAPVTPGGVSPADKIIFVLIPKAEVRAQSADKIDVMLYIYVKDARTTPVEYYSWSRYLTQK